MHPLDGCKLKFDRAEAHLNALDDAVQRFNNLDTCAIIPELNDQTGEVILKVKIMKSPPPEWAVIIGDIAHNLRSCLDHMTWQLALTQVSVPFDKTEFPIFTSRTLYNSNGLGKIGDLSTPQAAFIERLQPYHRGNDARNHPLWLLHELNNTDKHRLLPLANLAVFYGPNPMGKIGIFAPDGRKLAVKLTRHTKPGVPMEDGAKFLTLQILKLVSPQEKVYVEVEATSGIFFGPGIKANSGRKIDLVLKSMFAHVKSILLDCANQFFQGYTEKG